MEEVLLMIRSYKASRHDVLLSDLRHAARVLHVLLPEIAAGIALVLVLLMLPIMASLF